MEAVLPIILQVLALLPSLEKAGVSIIAAVTALEEALKSGSVDPNDAAWQAVNAEITANTDLINKA